MDRWPVVAVVGAINVDLVVSGAPLPGPGRTVTGGVFTQHHGGKGGNQSVAAARALGAGRGDGSDATDRSGVWMIGAVGNDPMGVAALDALRNDGVRTDHVQLVSAPTGVALINVGPNGENQIAVAPGANLSLSARRVLDALGSIAPDVVLASLEVDERAVRAALDWATEHGVASVLNPAPWQTWARGLVALASYVTPNEHELVELGAAPAGVTTIETRGETGAVIHLLNDTIVVAPPRVDAVDTTGAGDCFNGVLAAGLATGAPLEDAVRRAVVAAALSVTVPGAREGMPTAAEIAAAV